MKRFYGRAQAAATGDGHQVLLDDRPLRTPARHLMVLPSARLAEAIATEWEEQGEKVQPPAMPLTRMAATVVDRMPGQRAAAIEEAADYAGTDLLCYRAAEPLDLVQRQQHAWQPLLDWAGRTHDATFAVTTGLRPVAQPPATTARLRSVLGKLDDWQLVGVHAATTALGSLVLALALRAGHIDADVAIEASLLDELFEIERWGMDLETERRHQALRREVRAAAIFLERLAA
jgi:chaperone required for assembly of F1-ATPase